MRAPSWAGGWEGKSQEEICAVLTPRTTPEFWGVNTPECELIVNNHFNSFLVVGYMVLFCVCLYRVEGMSRNLYCKPLHHLRNQNLE